MIQTMQSHVGTACDAKKPEAERIKAWQAIAACDSTNVQARMHVTTEELQVAVRMRDAGEMAKAASQARQVMPRLHSALDDMHAYAKTAAATQKAPPMGVALLEHRYSNLAAVGHTDSPKVLAAIEAILELNLGLATEIATPGTAEVTPPNTSATAEAPNASATAEAAAAYEAIRAAIMHYERAAACGAKGEHANNIFSLWGDALERLEGREGSRRVWDRAVAAGLWLRPQQRPTTLLRELHAAPWHQPYKHAACAALRDAYPTIRSEAMALLRADGSASAASSSDPIFSPYSSKALKCGEWADVGLFFNGAINHLAVQRAPRTTALLRSDVGGLRRDAVACPLGSAYFSLLRPRTQLKAHCGPTNARLRAHLGLVVPDVPASECGIRCGDEPPRRWAEGEVLLFDDSYEHEVWNHTDEPRLVLIVDLWHPMLVSDQQRAKAFREPIQARRYASAVRGEFETTTMRGH